VAPTQKISDDDRFAPRQLAGAAPVTGPVTAPGVGMPRPAPPSAPVPQRSASAPSAPPLGSSPPAAAYAISTPPGASPQRPRSAPPGGSPGTGFGGTGLGARDPARPVRRPPDASAIDDPALSLPMPARRPWALIFAVLVIDLGLAVSGAWMLYQGLGGAAGAAGPDPSPARAR
jgi:hypothetical protein